MHQAAKADRHCREGIAGTGCGLGGHRECPERHYDCPPAALSEHAGLMGYQVVGEWNVPSAHLREFHTLGMSHKILNQS
jgi:hypothetical protein